MPSRRIAIIGARGLANYGGFETFVAELAPRLIKRGHEVSVSHRMPDKGLGQGEIGGVRILYFPLRFPRGKCRCEDIRPSLRLVFHAALLVPAEVRCGVLPRPRRRSNLSSGARFKVRDCGQPRRTRVEESEVQVRREGISPCLVPSLVPLRRQISDRQQPTHLANPLAIQEEGHAHPIRGVAKGVSFVEPRKAFELQSSFGREADAWQVLASRCAPRTRQ